MTAEISAKPYAEFKSGERSLAIVTKPGERLAGRDKAGNEKYQPYGAGDLLLIDKKTAMVITGPVSPSDCFNIAKAVLDGDARTLTESHAFRALAMFVVFKLGRVVVPAPQGLVSAASAEQHQAQDEIATSFGDGKEA